MSVGAHVVLVGMMGAGKTTVGRALATRLGRPFLDSDAMVEARTGQAVPQIFAERGEAAFRAEEQAVLSDAIGSGAPSVIAAAGGTVLDPGNRRIIAAAGLVVWLRADPAVLAGRVHPGDHRPLLADDPRGSLERLAAERDPLYAEVAGMVIDADTTPVTKAVELITARLAVVR